MKMNIININRKSKILFLFSLISLASLVICFIVKSMFGIYRFPSVEMEPSIKVNDIIIIRWCFLNSLKTGDLVAVKLKNSPDDIRILRIVGKPFDTIYWNKDGVYNPRINDEKLDIPSFNNSKSNSDTVVSLKENEYFLMSDNCEIIGRDSRTKGSFSSEEIIGIVSFVINR